MTTKRLLDVTIATHGSDGLKKVAEMNLPQVAGVNYVVSWQKSGVAELTQETLPEGLKRNDISIFLTSSTGLGANRNAALSHAEAPCCLVADNDLIYKPEGLKAVLRTMEEHPEVDVATFMYSGTDAKTYPSTETPLGTNLPKGYTLSAIELVFRRESIIKAGISFNEKLGIGAKYPSGEDSVFFSQCRRAGLNCRFFPIVITHHAGPSTGFRTITDKRAAIAEGIAIRYEYPFTGLLRAPLTAWRRHQKGRMPLWWGLFYILKGYFTKI